MEESEAWLARIASDWRGAELEANDRALLTYAEKLTRSPPVMRAEDVEALRAHGFDDLAIHDLIQVVAYFNYINRVAEAIEVELEPEMDS